MPRKAKPSIVRKKRGVSKPPFKTKAQIEQELVQLEASRADLAALLGRQTQRAEQAEAAEQALRKQYVKPKVFVAVPSGRSLFTGPTVSTIVGLTRSLIQNDFAGGFGTLAFPDVVEVRNIFTTIWYDKVQTSHLLFVDDDMAFDPQLVLDMIAFDKPLVGAVCPKRKLPIEFAGRAKAGPCQVINGHMEVEGVGGAVMLIRRDCMDAIMRNEPGIVDEVSLAGHAAKALLNEQGVNRLLKPFNKIVVNGEEFSEDLSFCKRWTATGGTVWGNIMHNVTHVGMHEYSGRYFDTIKDHMQPAQVEAVPDMPIEIVAEMMQAAE